MSCNVLMNLVPFFNIKLFDADIMCIFLKIHTYFILDCGLVLKQKELTHIARSAVLILRE